MIAKPAAHLMADLGVTTSHSRPQTSNDTPYIQSHVRTFTYRPDFPKAVGCYEDPHAHCGRFFGWYNDEAPSFDHWLSHPRRRPRRPGRGAAITAG
jgi:putative transposase